MNKIVKLTENQFHKILRQTVTEEVNGYSDKVMLVKDFLDNNFLRATNSTIGDDGCPALHDIVIWVDKFKQPKQYLNDIDLFYILQDKFKDILPQDEDDEDEEEDEKYDKAQEDVETIFNKAVKDAEKKIEKKVTHKNRDKFLQQCIKDWYYNKISKNGSLTLYEAHEIDRWQLSSYDYKKYLKERMNREQNIQGKYWNDNSENGANVIEDINFLCDKLMRRKDGVDDNGKKLASISMDTFICCPRDYANNGGMSDSRPDLYHVAYKILSNRAYAKWFFICPNLTDMFSPNVARVKALLQIGGECFKSKEARSEYLPFYTPLFVRHITPFLKDESLKNEVMSATEMTQELNIKIEQYLNEHGYEYVELPQQVQQDLNLDDFSLEL